MHRPLGVLQHSDVLHPEDFIAEAFVERRDKTCVTRQLAIVTEEPLDQVETFFDNLREDWRMTGITAHEVSQFCQVTRRPRFVVYKWQLIHAYSPP